MIGHSQIGSRERPYVFLSYAHVDRQIVHPHVLRLQQQGLEIWWDNLITPGGGWIPAIADAIVESSVFLLLVTRGVATSEYCFREILFAQDEQIPTVVSFLEEVRLPNRLRFLLSPIHAIVDGAGESNRLAETLRQALADARIDREGQRGDVGYLDRGLTVSQTSPAAALRKESVAVPAGRDEYQRPYEEPRVGRTKTPVSKLRS